LTGTLSWRVFLLSLPIAGLITLLLWINEFTDFEADRAAGKNNLVVRLGKQRAAMAYPLLVLFVFVATLFAVWTGRIGWPFLVVWLMLPLGLRSIWRAGNFDELESIRGAQADALKLHLFAGLLCSAGAIIGRWL
jgi:1,4-dihydroxy-2-naphthoate polyprenyltransferase